MITPLADRRDLASTIAVEHVVWAAQQDMSPLIVIESAGIRWTSRRTPDWHDVVLALTIAWRRLPVATPLPRAA